jgi:hypothetical protein
MTSSFISRKEKLLMFWSGIRSLCIMVSSEGLAGQEPQHQGRTLWLSLHLLLDWSWANSVLIVPYLSWVTWHGVLWLAKLLLQLSSNRRPGCSGFRTEVLPPYVLYRFFLLRLPELGPTTKFYNPCLHVGSLQSLHISSDSLPDPEAVWLCFKI